MQDNLKHKGRSVIRVISELLCETRRVAEKCSIGTSSDDAQLNLIYEERVRKGIPKNLFLPRSYCAEILIESHELTIDTAMQEWVMRIMFRSVWDTACCIKSLVETFVKDTSQISLRNALVMQRDLIDKIIDIPFIHRSGKGHQYLDFYAYVSAPQKMLHILPKILPNLMERGEDASKDIIKLFKIRLEAILDRLAIQRSVGQNGEDEVNKALGVIKVLAKCGEECAKLGDRIRYAREHHRADDVQALKDDIRAFIEGLMRDATNQLIAIFVEKYYPNWGDWIKLHPEEQQKKLHNQLKSWTKLKHKTKLRDGLLLYIDEGFYNLDTIKEHYERLPDTYHLHSLYVHDSIGDSTHHEQEWEESSTAAEILDVLQDICATAIYVASAHYYDCAKISDKMEPLQRIIREIQNC